MKKSLSRRDFLKSGTLVSVLGVSRAAAQTPGLKTGSPLLPTRRLGKTGVEVSTIGFGAGSRFCSIQDEEEAMDLLELAVELGITYFDTASSYTRKGIQRLSEKRLGEFATHHRGKVFVATKVDPRDRDGVLRSVEESLRLLKTDVIDLVQVHGLKGPQDVGLMGGPDGAVAALEELRDQKMIRFVGITGHNDGAAMRQALTRYDFDTVLMALNPAQSANPVADRAMQPLPEFEQNALPVALQKDMGVISMKAMGQDLLVGTGPGRAAAPDLLRFSLSLPVACVVVGIDAIRPVHSLRENAQVASQFVPMSEEDEQQLRNTVSVSRSALQDFFRHHDDSLPV